MLSAEALPFGQGGVRTGSGARVAEGFAALVLSEGAVGALEGCLRLLLWVLGLVLGDWSTDVIGGGGIESDGLLVGGGLLELLGR